MGWLPASAFACHVGRRADVRAGDASPEPGGAPLHLDEEILYETGAADAQPPSTSKGASGQPT